MTRERLQPTPRKIVFFVTSKCNARCIHCFLPVASRDPGREISLNNIFKIFASLNHKANITLTGGEPFLRGDFKTIVGAAMGLPLIQKVSICSNGSLPVEIERVLRSVCKKNKKPLVLHLSLDGFQETHDALRKQRYGFSRVLETCERLRRIAGEFPYFSFDISCTILRQNIAEIARLVDFLEEMGYPSKLTLARGNAFSTFGVPQELLHLSYGPRCRVMVKPQQAWRLMERISKKHPHYFSSFQKKKLEVMLKTLIFEKRQIPCYAGYIDAVVYSNGDVGMCEQIRPFGNLSQWDWDLGKAWDSEPARQHRRGLTSCACIHGCNIGTSIHMASRRLSLKT